MKIRCKILGKLVICTVALFVYAKKKKYPTIFNAVKKMLRETKKKFFLVLEKLKNCRGILEDMLM